MKIRAERESDYEAISKLNERVFPSAVEARLVERLRETAQPFISLVAIEENELLGHIVFSPVTLFDDPSVKLMGLAPMAVTPTHQCQGIGSALVEAGLQRCRLNGSLAVVVLGHPEYYPRFGFEPAVDRGLCSEYDVPADTFLILELEPGGLKGNTGMVQYHPVFSSLEDVEG